jgi:hypothetical protein
MLGGRAAISLTPRFRPVIQSLIIGPPTVFNGFGIRGKPLKRLKKSELFSYHRPEAMVLMRSLRALSVA